LAALLIAGAVLPGCILELLTTTAIQGELQAQNAASATKQLEHTRRMADEMKVKQAIDVYRAENAAYPPSLEALVPEYLDAVPVDPIGKPLFAYDPSTGWFGDPAKAPGSARASSMPISGGSPVAEQVEAIGIMNELNAQPGPTSDIAREQANDITTQQNERYESLLDDLNL
jgi:hypothetical protein